MDNQQKDRKHTEEEYRELGHNVAQTFIRTIPRDQLFEMPISTFRDLVKEAVKDNQILREFMKIDRIPKLVYAYYDGVDDAIENAF